MYNVLMIIFCNASHKALIAECIHFSENCYAAGNGKIKKV